MLHRLDASGSPAALGAALGRFTRDVLGVDITRGPLWALAQRHRDGPAVAAMLDASRRHCPRIVDEIAGIAEALGLPFAAVFAWHCRGDLLARGAEGCTTVTVPAPEAHVIAHNEDGDPELIGRCGLVRLAGDDGRTLVGFVYPGSILGHTFAVNDVGLVATVNNVRSRAGGDGVPRQIVARAVLDCTSLDAAVALVGALPRAGGYNLSLAQAGDRRLISLEFTAARVSAVEIAAPAVHANHLIHAAMAGEAQRITASSASRQARGEALLAAGAGPEAIVADDHGELPIRRRDPADPDGEVTHAMALFRIAADGVTWRVEAGAATYGGRGVAVAGP